MCHSRLMNIDAIKNKAKFYVEKAKAFLPSSLPQGESEFNAWVDSLSTLFKLPTAARTDLEHVFCSMIINLGPLEDKKPKYYFVKAIRMAAAKQVAGSKFYEIQMAKKAAHEASVKAAQAKSVEVTTNLKVVPSNEPTAG